MSHNHGMYQPTYDPRRFPPDGMTNSAKIESVEVLLRNLIAEVQGLRSELRSDRLARDLNSIKIVPFDSRKKPLKKEGKTASDK